MKREQTVVCGCCNSKDALFLHNIRQRGIFRRFCTNCVLKTHVGLFCPICLEVYNEQPPPPHQRLICLKCPSICHLSCPSEFSNSATFICPSCRNPGFNFFNPRPFKKLKTSSETEPSPKDEDPKFINQEASKALMVAAKLSAGSMAKAAVALKVEAEKKVKEAALARKRAKEALEKLVFWGAQEKGSLKEAVVTKSKVSADGETRSNGLAEAKGTSNGVHSVSKPVNAPKLQSKEIRNGM